MYIIIYYKISLISNSLIVFLFDISKRFIHTNFEHIYVYLHLSVSFLTKSGTLTDTKNKVAYWDPLKSSGCPQEFVRSRGTGAVGLSIHPLPGWQIPTEQTDVRAGSLA